MFFSVRVRGVILSVARKRVVHLAMIVDTLGSSFGEERKKELVSTRETNMGYNDNKNAGACLTPWLNTLYSTV